MLMVDPAPEVVEAQLLAGELRCPCCRRGNLRPWGHGLPRTVKGLGGLEVVRPRRGRCGSAECRVTSMLLPDLMLVRRAYTSDLILEGLRIRAEQEEGKTSWAAVAVAVSACKSTVRGWMRRFVERAVCIRDLFTSWAIGQDAELAPAPPRRTEVLDALEAIGTAARVAVKVLGQRTPGQCASVLTGGHLLSPAVPLVCNAS